ncbi:mechanosensitive ion channel family protein [Gilvibacter sediminis]|uniref:mechanosensitive ion channel family protein n=1 Tax=Gilvibacter sediminis TaxID=379071 RepID=UPI0023507F1F|nr:mechanosensitive ion channel domain-containing protein [Gilvibacter sediminis]MDC7999311.1 mechanosensitive ion channel [Gilvibacter sediminis]
MVKILALIQDESLAEEATEIGKSLWASIREFLNRGFHFGEGDKQIHLTIGLILTLVIAIFVSSFALNLIRKWLTRRMEEENRLKFVSIFKFLKYLIYMLVILLTMNAAGINVTVLLTASAALFVGLGLALQELFQDIIGGIFIIVDKSLLVGDIIEINGKVGKVIEIRLRTTRCITRDDKVIIIPNHKFISDTVFNYTQNHKMTREGVTVGVAYGSDTRLVEKLLLECVQSEPGILKRPEPRVLFQDFGDSALIFSVFFYVTDSFKDPLTKSNVRFKIDEAFRANDISIPFPQRDLHIKTMVSPNITGEGNA